MGQPSEARVDAGFEFVRALRHIERHWDEYRNPASWTRLNPHLTVSETPFRSHYPELTGVPPTIVDRALAQLDTSGFFATPPVVPESRIEREVTMEQFDLQDVRAVPVPAGSVVAWSTHLIHWGGRSTPEAVAPRMSITMYLQRADLPPFDASVFDRVGQVPLESRLRWVIQALGAHELIPRLFPV